MVGWDGAGQGRGDGGRALQISLKCNFYYHGERSASSNTTRVLSRILNLRLGEGDGIIAVRGRCGRRLLTFNSLY